jgi:hypothetical protein
MLQTPPALVVWKSAPGWMSLAMARLEALSQQSPLCAA